MSKDNHFAVGTPLDLRTTIVQQQQQEQQQPEINKKHHHLVVGTPLEFNTLSHSSLVSFPSPSLSARVNIRRTCISDGIKSTLIATIKTIRTFSWHISGYGVIWALPIPEYFRLIYPMARGQYLVVFKCIQVAMDHDCWLKHAKLNYSNLLHIFIKIICPFHHSIPR